MVSAAKAFAKEPPRRPLDNLSAICEDFKWRYVDRKKTDQVIAWCAAAPDLPAAVSRAVEARDENGKHHNHQSKVDITARRKFGRKITRSFQGGRLPIDDFDAMHDKLNFIKPYGIGPVTVYDVAIRIAAFLDIEPNCVYLHAGVRQGLKAFEDALERTGAPFTMRPWLRADKVPLSAFPRPFNSMKADDVEDILCTYREVFDGWGR
jgi:hypothetical protein